MFSKKARRLGSAGFARADRQESLLHERSFDHLEIKQNLPTVFVA
jgi:hypothetical protein